MAETTGISWTDHTFNPWWGCVKVSPACDFCYAERDAKRYGHDIWGKDAPRRFFSDKHWDGPLKWNSAALKDGIRRRVFCASMADVLEDRRDLDESRDRLWRLIESTPYLDWLLLSKRPRNFHRWLPVSLTDQGNVWLGTTIESPEYLWRIEDLKRTPCDVHFLSIEPLLADIPEIGDYLSDIEWVITGGESDGGRKTARPAPADWFRRIRDAAVSRDIPFHFKQWGEHDGDLIRIGKRKAGSELDGREWKEFPRLAASGSLSGKDRT